MEDICISIKAIKTLDNKKMDLDPLLTYLYFYLTYLSCKEDVDMWLLLI